MNTKNNCCIINFHGVRRLNNPVFNNRHLPETEFEKIILNLKKNYNIVSLKEIFEIHRGKKKATKKTVALTFDDGYLNNFEVAFPILKRLNIPATFYIITKGLIEKDFVAWPDLVDFVKKNNTEDIVINRYLFKAPSFYCDEIGYELLNYIKTLGDESENTAKQLIVNPNWILNEIRSNPELVVLIDGSKISKYINEPLIEFGSHTHTHFSFEYLKKNMAETELRISKEILEKFTKKSIISLAFPDGSYKTETIELAKNFGYENLTAVSYKYSENNSNPFLLSRFTISNSTTYESNMLRLAIQFTKYGFR